jgi:uncharacterized protein YozE (UPF0346 family)
MNMAPQFKLVENWVAVIKYAYSFMFSVLSSVMAGSAAMLQFYPQDSPEFVVITKVLTTAAAFLAGMSAFSRVWQQKNVTAVSCIKKKTD